MMRQPAWLCDAPLSEFAVLGSPAAGWAVSVSVDGCRARTHDGVRGIAGHFEITIAATAQLVDAGITVSATVLDGICSRGECDLVTAWPSSPAYSGYRPAFFTTALPSMTTSSRWFDTVVRSFMILFSSRFSVTVTTAVTVSPILTGAVNLSSWPR